LGVMGIGTPFTGEGGRQRPPLVDRRGFGDQPLVGVHLGPDHAILILLLHLQVMLHQPNRLDSGLPEVPELEAFE
jgi:hypothetical protein